MKTNVVLVLDEVLLMSTTNSFMEKKNQYFLVEREPYLELCSILSGEIASCKVLLTAEEYLYFSYFYTMDVMSIIRSVSLRHF